jgi:hypothetical protein
MKTNDLTLTADLHLAGDQQNRGMKCGSPWLVIHG